MDFRNLGHRVRLDEDPCVDTYLDTDWFDQAYVGRAKVYHNIYLNERVFLRLVIVSDEGLYAIVPYKDRADAGIGMEIRRILGVDAENSEIIFHGEDNSLVLSRDGRFYVCFPDFIEAEKQSRIYYWVCVWYYNSFSVRKQFDDSFRVAANDRFFLAYDITRNIEKYC